MKTVIAFGTFDTFHAGHKSYLKQARKLGDKLVVIVARDVTVKNIKGQKPKNNEDVRLQKVREKNLADEVVLGDLEDKYKVLEKYRPDVIALGYDQKVNIAELKDRLKELNISAKIVRLNSFKPEIYKSSKMSGK